MTVKDCKGKKLFFDDWVFCSKNGREGRVRVAMENDADVKVEFGYDDLRICSKKSLIRLPDDENKRNEKLMLLRLEHDSVNL